MTVAFEGRWDPNRRKIKLSLKTTRALSNQLDELIGSARDSKAFCEMMKTSFGNTSRSKDVSWARSDLSETMRGKSEDGAEYLRCFWDGISKLREHEDVPGEEYFNKILRENNEPFRIDREMIRQDIGDMVLVESDVSSVPQISKEFTLGELLGQGGFGVVHRLRKTTSIGTFDTAIKILHPSPFNTSNNSPERFKREVELLNKLQHRSVVQIIESGYLPDGRAYYQMPLIEGKTLRDATEGCEPTKVIRIFLEVCEGVEFMHKKGVLHRDLKPTNVMIRESDGQAIILDFGCAFSLDFLDQNSLTKYAIGSLAYMPPEVMRNPKHRSKGHDIYSLGVMLYECLARSLPAFESYSPLSSIRKELEVLDVTILEATKVEFERFASISDLRKSLVNANKHLKANYK